MIAVYSDREVRDSDTLAVFLPCWDDPKICDLPSDSLKNLSN
jgi:hypothetical protein